MTSVSGQVIRLPIDTVSTVGRSTQGVRLIRLEKNDRTAALTTLEDDAAPEAKKA